jgi:hypothetical protein
LRAGFPCERGRVRMGDLLTLSPLKSQGDKQGDKKNAVLPAIVTLCHPCHPHFPINHMRTRPRIKRNI